MQNKVGETGGGQILVEDLLNHVSAFGLYLRELRIY